MTNLREKQNHAEREKNKTEASNKNRMQDKGHKKQPDKIERLCAFRMDINFSKSNHQPISKKDK